MTLKTELVQTLMETVDRDSLNTMRADTIRVWRILFDKFSPLVGQLTVYVLFMRSLDANRASFPWLPPVDKHDLADMSFDKFESLLASQPDEEVLTATRALLGTYIETLLNLIGITLTGKFVYSAVAALMRK
jgi:hypothetical protein